MSAKLLFLGTRYILPGVGYAALTLVLAVPSNATYSSFSDWLIAAITGKWWALGLMLLVASLAQSSRAMDAKARALHLCVAVLIPYSVAATSLLKVEVEENVLLEHLLINTQVYFTALIFSPPIFAFATMMSFLICPNRIRAERQTKGSD